MGQYSRTLTRMNNLRVLAGLAFAVMGIALSACGDGRTSQVEAAFRAAAWGEEGDTVEIVEVKNERVDVDGPEKIAGKRYDVKARVGKRFKSVRERSFVVFVADQGEHSSVQEVR